MATALLLLAAPLHARAAGAPGRCVAVVGDVVDGEPRDSRTAELALVGALVERGVPVADLEQTRAIRALASPDQLPPKELSRALTAFDADVAVLGVARARKLTSELLGPSYVRYIVSAEGKLVEIDTGATLATLTSTGSAADFVPERAAELALRRTGLALARALSTRLAATSDKRTIELRAAGIPNVTQAEGLARAVAGLPGVTSVRVLDADPRLTRIALEVDRRPARELAVAIDRLPAAGVAVHGYSDSAIRADYDPVRALQVTLHLRAFEGGASLARTLPSLIGGALAAAPAFSAAPEPAPLPSTRPWIDELRAAGVDPARAVVLTGSYQIAGERVDVEARLLSGKGGNALMARRAQCSRSELTTCAGELGERMALELSPALERSRQILRGRDTRPADRSVTIESVRFDDLYPAQAARYAGRPVGVVKLRSSSKAPIARVVVAATAAPLAPERLEGTPATLPANGSIEVPLVLAIDPAYLAAIVEPRVLLARVEVAYEQDGMIMREERTASIVIHDRQAFEPGDPAALSSFADPRDAEVVRLARAIHAGLPPGAEMDPLALPAAIVEAFALIGLRYAPDPSTPHGARSGARVQHARQTLALGSGDCDDLAVAVGAVAEALDVPAAIVRLPDHAIVALATGVPARNRRMLAVNPARLLDQRGEAWLPIETASIARSFTSAWSAAARAVAKTYELGEEPEVIELREAWRTRPPASASADKANVAMPAAGALRERVSAALEAARRMRDAEIDPARRAMRSASGGHASADEVALLSQVGLTRDARELLDRLPASRSTSVLDANLHLVEGRAAEASDRYRAAAEKWPRDVEVLLDAAIAAAVAGEEDVFVRYASAALDAGGTAAVEALARISRGRLPGLRTLIGRAHARAGKPPPNLPPADTAGSAPEREREELLRLLYWP